VALAELLPVQGLPACPAARDKLPWLRRAHDRGALSAVKERLHPALLISVLPTRNVGLSILNSEEPEKFGCIADAFFLDNKFRVFMASAFVFLWLLASNVRKKNSQVVKDRWWDVNGLFRSRWSRIKESAYRAPSSKAGANTPGEAVPGCFANW
jgi:hypothetical protein